MIRKATKADLSAMLEIAQCLADESSYSHIKLSKARVKTTIETMIEHGFAMVAELDGKIVGGMLGDTFTPWYSEDKVAIDYSLYVLPAHRNGLIAYKLVKAFEKWAISMGAKQMRPGIGTGNPSMARLYEKMGFQKVGSWHLKNI